MKKLPIAAAVAGVLTGSAAMAYDLGQYANGILVPDVSYASTSETTTVGLTTNCAGNVYWTFFDVNSNHVTDGSFAMTANDQHAFIWATEAGGGLDNVNGYLVFTISTPNGTVPADADLDTADGVCLAGNAFYVDVPASDVAYVPAVPLYLRAPSGASAGAFADGTLNFGEDYGDTGVADLTAMTATSVAGLSAGAQSGSVNGATQETIDMRYYIDQAPGGNDTVITLWSVGDVTNGTSGSASFTVNIYDDKQNRKSVNFVLPNNELNRFDPETILGIPSTYLDGFIRWPVNAVAAGSNGDAIAVFSYSTISAPAFGAVQTLLNAHWTTNH